MVKWRAFRMISCLVLTIFEYDGVLSNHLIPDALITLDKWLFPL